MRTPRRSADVFRGVFVLCAMLVLPACTAWHTKSPNRQAQITTFPKPLRVKLLDGSDVILTEARLERDTIFGNVQRGTLDTVAIARTFPVHTVDVVQVREISASRTVALTAGAALVVRSGIYLFGLLLFSGW